jgi:hypothetical protein
MGRVHRRIDHGGIAAITLAHPVTDEFGVDRHQVDAVGGADVPHADIVKNGARDP